MSIFFYIKAQGVIGAVKTSAYYAIVPFVGTLLSFLLLRETPTPAYFIGLAVMLAGTGIVVADTLIGRRCHCCKRGRETPTDGQ